MDWNPNAPNLIGLEFPVKNQAGGGPSTTVTGQTKAVVQRMASTADQTVGAVSVYMQGGGPRTRFLTEIIAEGYIAEPVTSTPCQPSDSPYQGDWSSTTSPFYEALRTDTSGSISISNGTAAVDAGFGLNFETASALPATQRIVGFKLHITGRETGNQPVGGQVALHVVALGTTHVINFVMPSKSNTTVTIDFGEIAFGGQPYTLAQVEAFETSVDFDFYAELTASESGEVQVGLVIEDVWLEVLHCDENRVCAQVVETDNRGPQWVTWTPRTPTGGTNFVKQNGITYDYIFRQPRYGTYVPPGINTTFSIPMLEGLKSAPPDTADCFASVTINPDGTFPEALGAWDTSLLIGVDLNVSGSTVADAQTYAIVREKAISVGSADVGQEVTGASAQSYEAVLLPIRYEGTPNDMLVQVFEGLSVIATATVTMDDWDAASTDPAGLWRMVQVEFDSAPTLAAATTYSVRLYEIGDGDGTWYVQYLDTGGFGGQCGYGGQTINSTEGATTDMAIALVSVPTGPSGFDAAAFTDETYNNTASCSVEGVPGILLTWNATDNALFDYYEIQREDDFTDWKTIAEIEDEDVEAFYDYECRLGLESRYRIRLVNTLGVHSVWSSEQAATCAVSGCGYTFTSNEAPEYNVAYGDTYSSSPAIREYGFPEAEEVEFVRLYLRDYQVGFRPLERRGVTFERRLLVNALAAPTRPGPSTFGPLRDIAKAALSYVCVRDEDGNRFFATLQVPEAQVQKAGHFYWAGIAVTETTSTPSRPNVQSLPLP